MADTESVLSFIPPTLPPSSVCSLNFPLFADCLISPSMPDCFPAFSKQHNRRMASYGVRARHCNTIQPLLDKVLLTKLKVVPLGRIAAVPGLRVRCGKELLLIERAVGERWKCTSTSRSDLE